MTAGSIGQQPNTANALGANFVVIQMSGRSFFELKQLVRFFCGSYQPACSDELDRVIKELEGHAHR